jgi:hypothetical protein
VGCIVTSNPYLFPGPGQWNYSRFPSGQIGSNLSNTQETGKESTPEATFQIPPGQPAPTAWQSNIGNVMGPGGKANTTVPPPSGVLSEQQFANQ